MASKKQKYYVVWCGKAPGIYDNWKACELQVKGVEGARYKSYDSLPEAEEAYRSGYSPAIVKSGGTHTQHASVIVRDSSGIASLRPGTTDGPILDSVAVDAACSGNPGVMEYQGVYVASGTRLFHYKTAKGTNNIGEFLGLVHGLSYLKKNKLNQVLYSDSVNAISWVKQKKCKSKLPVTEQTKELWEYVHRAEAWLYANTYTTEIRKWDTDHWGEIPADFGRK
ncbi:MAG: ribonuclease H family protein [Bacteroidales bacterium]|nr:ribonuclease H family protein [Candidatus Colimorpha onthohippi]